MLDAHRHAVNTRGVPCGILQPHQLHDFTAPPNEEVLLDSAVGLAQVLDCTVEPGLTIGDVHDDTVHLRGSPQASQPPTLKLARSGFRRGNLVVVLEGESATEQPGEETEYNASITLRSAASSTAALQGGAGCSDPASPRSCAAFLDLCGSSSRRTDRGALFAPSEAQAPFSHRCEKPTVSA